MTSPLLPTDPADLALDILNRHLDAGGARMTGFAVTEAHAWGGGEASSAGRICIEAEWDAAGAALPRRVVLKVARCDPADPHLPERVAGAGGALYSNELAIYRHVQPARFLEAPLFLGGAFDAGSNALLLMLEDLRGRGATFPHVTVPTSQKRITSLLDQLAILHARYWNCPEFAAMDWLQSHVAGPIHDQFASPRVLPPHARAQLAADQFRREMVERLGTDVDGLFRQVHAVQAHQAGRHQTICHGDTHIGNTYALPDDSGGLLDWQLSCRGHPMHDVAYLLATGLSIGERRAWERDLLGHYRGELLRLGACEVPGFDELWREYRMAMVWGVFIGWLITPLANYGWEKTVMAHLRMMTAYEDLETGRLIDALD